MSWPPCPSLPAIPAQSSLAQAPGSASRRVGPDWIDYLKDTGNYERYDGMCDCYVCRQIQKDYWPWKERKQNK